MNDIFMHWSFCPGNIWWQRWMSCPRTLNPLWTTQKIAKVSFPTTYTISNYSYQQIKTTDLFDIKSNITINHIIPPFKYRHTMTKNMKQHNKVPMFSNWTAKPIFQYSAIGQQTTIFQYSAIGQQTTIFPKGIYKH